MKHVKLNNGHQLAILNLIDLDTCIFYEYNWYVGNTFSNLTNFYSYSLAISNDLLSLALLKTSHYILYQLIVWLFGMVCQISL